MAGFEGGCECGSVRYRMISDPIFVNCCHCRDCQKISGSDFAINAIIEADRIELLTGEQSLVRSEGSTRCGKCNALLWGEHRMFGDRLLFVRVGTLDEAEKIAPDAHFFVRSKHPWINLPDGVPSFETLPGEGDPPLVTGDAAARMEAARA